MCGIAGICAANPCGEQVNIAKRMGEALDHRGPDDKGIWHDRELGTTITHQRLAILDLSKTGAQPMISDSGRYVIAFNGEIYNHQSLRKKLEEIGASPRWKGTSDTETLLAGIEAWGLTKTLNECAGMWAFALIDRQRKIMHLVRDRFGEKPLYWGQTEGESNIVFASELSALMKHPYCKKEVNRFALRDFLSFGYVPTPRSIYQGIFKLEPGHMVSIKLPYSAGSSLPESKNWWSLSTTMELGVQNQFDTDSEAVACLEKVLRRVVKEQADADVPVGTFLSGGIDSSLVTALIQAEANTRLRTFTIGFEEQKYNEAPFAKAIANHLGTDHNEFVITSKDALGIVPNIASIYSEPFADSSQLPTYLVSEYTRNAGIKVAVTGDGGDELFGGYRRYIAAPRLWGAMSRLRPRLLRKSVGLALSRIPNRGWNMVGNKVGISYMGQKVNRVISMSESCDSIDQVYASLVKTWEDPELCMKADLNSSRQWEESLKIPTCLANDAVSRMMYWDASNYLTDDILAKVDRAAMSVSLETRAPLLDNRVVEVACRLRSSMRVRDGVGKWALREILYKHVPSEVVDRPKAGFAIPLGKWLRGPLRDWAESLLEPKRLEREGYLRPEAVRYLWDQHMSGNFDHSSKLWNLLMWQSWLERYG